MTDVDDRVFPAALAAALAEPFDYDGGDGVDFEPFEGLLSAADTTDWFRAWTGNGELTGDAFRVFGMNGAGGYAAFWLVRQGRPLEDQPVVLLGSEGETGVIARDLGDFLWLLAEGYGPFEAISAFTGYEPEWTARPNERLTAVAERFAPHGRRAGAEIIRSAARAYPDFDETLMNLCR
ncbi:MULTISPECIES: SMI1/KNR4 family protein [unclassified Streptomyces]|uniref:SMI1/KNR4 family protein n=1 Tax=unclassified Streptomyces TaxID=2593676 RepID=UPI0022B685B2|nr:MULTISPECIES: SMI1/KNR4 family protein [unclassified Streptomyces]MCZ7416779.1 SMI1/KNR4 family protein [Streptomyces sp. WMMC897]MCZ7433411.1 SMI1/KNR4 family protein [Streptomyces sp. WMMC1477]